MLISLRKPYYILLGESIHLSSLSPSKINSSYIQSHLYPNTQHDTMYTSGCNHCHLSASVSPNQFTSIQNKFKLKADLICIQILSIPYTHIYSYQLHSHHSFSLNVTVLCSKSIENFKNQQVPNFKGISAKITDPAISASTWASGDQI